MLAILASAFGVLGMSASAAPAAPDIDRAAVYQATGTVTVSKYVCAGLDTVVWGGAPDGNCVAGSAGFVFYLIGDGTDASWSLDVNGTGTITLPAGSYEVWENGNWTQGTVTVTAGANTALTVLNPGAPLPPPEPETGFVTVEKFFCPGVTAVSYDPGLVDQSCTVGDATFAFYLYGDGADDFWPLSVGADGVGTIELAVGTYQVVEQGTFTSVDVVVTTGATSFLTVVNPGGAVPEPEPVFGFVDAFKLYCPDVDAAFFAGDDDEIPEECVTGPATFTFYLVGDGTGDFWQLDVWEDGAGFIDLVPGTYEVYEEGTGIMTTIEVVANEGTFITAVNPGDPPAPRDGTVNLSKFYCSNIEEVIFSSNAFEVTFAASLPTFEPACEPGEATFTFYLVGDGTADYEQITVDGTGSIVLPPGTYEVIEEGTLASTFITVFPGDFITLDVQNPTGEFVPGASVNVVKFYCDTVTETEFIAYDGIAYSERDQLPTAPDCLPGPATFTFYLVGDGTADYAQLHVDGSGSIGLEPGVYEVVEEETQAKFTFEVFDGENTVLYVNNPMPDDGEVPDDGHKPAPDKDKDTGGVTKLPSTGSGTTDGTGMLALAVAVAAVMSGAGAITMRKRR
jgi:hypothetical protein